MGVKTIITVFSTGCIFPGMTGKLDAECRTDQRACAVQNESWLTLVLSQSLTRLLSIHSKDPKVPLKSSVLIFLPAVSPLFAFCLMRCECEWVWNEHGEKVKNLTEEMYVII